MLEDNALSCKIVLKIFTVALEAICSFFGLSLSYGYYPLVYQPPEGVYSLNSFHVNSHALIVRELEGENFEIAQPRLQKRFDTGIL